MVYKRPKNYKPPEQKSRALAEGFKEDDAVNNIFAFMRDVSEAEFYNAVDPDQAAAAGLSSDDSRVIRGLPLETTVLEAAKEELPKIRKGPYATQLEISGQHNPNDVSHH